MNLSDLLKKSVPHYYRYRLLHDFEFFYSEVLDYLKQKYHAEIFTRANFHNDWIKLFLSDERFIKILSFRGSAKTTFWSFIVPLFTALKYPYSLIVLISSSLDQSVQNVGNIRNFIEDIFPEMKGSVWQKKIIRLSNKSKIIAKSVKSNIRGVKNLKERPSLIICDDIISDNPSLSMEDYKKFYYEAILPSLSSTGRIIVVGTPFLPGDLLSELNYTTITTPIIDSNGAPTWEELYNKDQIEDIKRHQTPISWCRNYLVKSITEVGQIFKKEWLKTTDIELKDPIKIMGVDPAIRKNELSKSDSDYFAYTMLRYSPAQKIIIVDEIYHARIGFNTQIELIKTKGVSSDYIVIESNFYQSALTQYLIKNTMLNIVPIESRRDKVERISELAPFFQNQKILFSGAEINPDFMVEYLGFPGKKIHDDMLDSLHIAVSYAVRKAGKKANEVIIF